MASVKGNRSDDLRTEKEMLMEKIRQCKYEIDQISERNEIALQADSDDDVGDEFLRYNLRNRGTNGSTPKGDTDSLKYALKATEEITSLVIHNYSIDVLNVVPEDLNSSSFENYSKHDVWKQVDMTCSMDWIPFRLSYIIREPIKDRKHRSYHNLRFVIDRPQPALELSLAELTTDSGPVIFVNQLRQYIDLCRQRMAILHKLKDFENKLFKLEKADDGGYMLSGTLFHLRWFVKLKSGKLLFAYDLETDEDYEDFTEGAKALVKELEESERARTDLLEALIKSSYEISTTDE